MTLYYYIAVYEDGKPGTPASDFFQIHTFNDGEKVRLHKKKIPWHNNAGIYMLYQAIKRSGYMSFMKNSDKHTHPFSAAAIDKEPIPAISVFVGSQHVKTSNVYVGRVLESSWNWHQELKFFNMSVKNIWLRHEGDDHPFAEQDFITVDIQGFNYRPSPPTPTIL